MSSLIDKYQHCRAEFIRRLGWRTGGERGDDLAKGVMIWPLPGQSIASYGNHSCAFEAAGTIARKAD
jgi:hypothetical protein